ncbi:chromosome partitioning protein ParA, partial [Tychonema sp. BBK16]
LHQTQGELEQSQAQLHQTQGELEQSQAQLHQTQGELEQSQAQLHQTQGELEQSQNQLHQTQGELEQSQNQLHQTQGELERLKFQPIAHRQADVQSQTQYEFLLWEAWFAYHKGDLKGMAHFLKESFKCTPFSPTETILNWLESLAHFSSDKGYNLDTNSLINSVEWKELTRRTLTNGKVTLSRL